MLDNRQEGEVMRRCLILVVLVFMLGCKSGEMIFETDIKPRHGGLEIDHMRVTFRQTYDGSIR